MEDNEIIELYFERSEKALKETQCRYGAYCLRVAYNILRSREDSEECVNDTWLRAWHSIPPERPLSLGAFLFRITRNISISLLRKRTAKKRNRSEAYVCIDELSECIPDSKSSSVSENAEIKDALNWFIASLNDETARIFIFRYWYVMSIKEISGQLSMSEGAVKMSLYRTREKLKIFLQEEGISI